MSPLEILPDDEVDDRPLTAAERKALRILIIREQRVQWFWGTVRVWASWISGAIIGCWAIFEIVRKIWTKNL